MRAVAAGSLKLRECRPPWREGDGAKWTRFPIARLRYVKARREWSLYWRDRNLKFHEDGRVVASKDRDFRDSHLLGPSPRRLLVVATGTSPTATGSVCSPSTSPHLRLLSSGPRWSSLRPTLCGSPGPRALPRTTNPRWSAPQSPAPPPASLAATAAPGAEA